MILEFRNPVRGTLPIWYDASYWWDGLRVPLSPQRQLAGLFRPFTQVHSIQTVFLSFAAALVPFCLLSARVRKVIRGGGIQTWILILWPAATCLMYSMVLFNFRYVAAYLVLICLGAVALILQPLPSSVRTKTLFAAALLLAVVCGVRLLGSFGASSRQIGRDNATSSMAAAQGLVRLGIQPGDEIAVLGHSLDCYYARVAGVRIVAQIWEDSGGDCRLERAPGESGPVPTQAGRHQSAGVTLPSRLRQRRRMDRHSPHGYLCPHVVVSMQTSRLLYTSGKMNLTRRSLFGMAAAAPLAMAAPAPAVKLGIDLFSLRSQNWTPFQLLDYSAKLGAKVVHFSEIRFIGSLEPENLRAVRRYAEERGIEIEIGMKSICPTSKMFDAKAGTAEEQIGRMLDSATLAGSHIVRAVLGSSEDRRPGPIEKHIESTVKVLRNVRSKAQDHNLKIAIENHAGDMQAHELKQLIEEAGKDFVGACLDSGNPLWTLEDPHVTLETLHPYVLTSHVRDSAVWRVPEGAAVSWVRMGQGNVASTSTAGNMRSSAPGARSRMESIVTNPRVFAFRDPKVLGRIPRRSGVVVRPLPGNRRPRQTARRRTPAGQPGGRAPARTRRPGSQHRIHEEASRFVSGRDH